MKYPIQSSFLLLFLAVVVLPVAKAQHIKLQPATNGLTTIFSPTLNDTVISVTSGRTIRLKPGVNGIVVGNAVGTQYVFPAARGTTGQQLSLDASGNLVWGTPSSLTGLTNTNNTSLGISAGTALTTGTENVFAGASAGSATTIAKYNTAVGHQALTANVTGQANTALGYGTLQFQSFTNGGTAYFSGNTAIGYQALKNNQPAAASSSGNANTAVGYNALLSNTTGYENTAMGHSALDNVTTGYQNVAVGENAGGVLTTGNNNTFLGRYAGQNATASVNNIFIGATSAANVTSSSSNIAIGKYALLSLSFSNAGTAWNAYNIAIGEQALGSLNPTTTSEATYNIGIGINTLSNNITGNRNIAIGGAAGMGVLGSDNILIGYQAAANLGAISNKLHIGPSATPLIGGDFSTDEVSIVGTLKVGLSGSEYIFPNAKGTNGQVLATNASGVMSWTTISGGADNLGNHTATQALNLGTNKLVGNGGTTGLAISAAGAVTLDNNLSVTGTSTFTGSIAVTGGATVTGATTLGGGTTFNTLTNAFTMPTTRATASGQVLTATNATGGLAWGLPVEINNGTSVSRVVATGTAVDFYTASALSWRMTGNRLENQGTTNVIVGRNSGASATGSTNTIVGFNNGTGVSFSSNTNTLVGNNLGNALTTGGDNAFIGSASGMANTTGYANIAIGSGAFNNNQTGANNVAIGTNALNGSGSSGSFSNNTAIGSFSLNDNSTGADNTALGSEAGINTTTGSQNTFIGRSAGYTNITGTGNVFIGNQAGYNETGSNKLYIDNSNTAFPLIGGDFNTNQVSINGSMSITGAINGSAATFSGGGVSAADYVYYTAVSRSTTVSHLKFFGMANGLPGTIGNGTTTLEYSYFTASPVIAPLDLPEGATVTGFSVVMSQAIGGTSTMKLMKMTNGGTVQMGQVNVIGALATPTTVAHASFTTFTVANATETYALVYDGSQNGSNNKLYRVIVNYTVAKPD